VLPIPIDSLRDAALIDLWHREKGMLASHCAART